MDLVRRMGSLVATAGGPHLLRLDRAVAATKRFAYFRLVPLEEAFKIPSGSPLPLALGSLDPSSFG